MTPIFSWARGRRFRWDHVLTIPVFHLLALLAFWPQLFSWAGVGVFFVTGAATAIGISVCWHRLLAHRSFACPLWLEHAMALMGACSIQGSPVWWVAVHRLHHKHADKPGDPHSPLVAFLWAHLGWIIVVQPDTEPEPCEKYVPDIMRDPFYRWLHCYGWVWFVFFHVLAIGALGYLYGYLTGTDPITMAASFLVWGVFFRIVVVWHFTFAVNSVTHLWGYRNYETGENSRNNWLVALLTYGEGWHNNHHAQPRSASHGHKWWEFDLGFAFIRLLEGLGLAWNVVRPRPATTPEP